MRVRLAGQIGSTLWGCVVQFVLPYVISSILDQIMQHLSGKMILLFQYYIDQQRYLWQSIMNNNLQKSIHICTLKIKTRFINNTLLTNYKQHSVMKSILRWISSQWNSKKHRGSVYGTINKITINLAKDVLTKISNSY